MRNWFATSRGERQRSASATGGLGRTTSTVVASRDSLRLLSNKPVELPDPDLLFRRQSAVLENEQYWRKAPVVTRTRFSVSERPVLSRVSFSAPLFSGTKHKEPIAFPSRLQLPHESVHEFDSCSDVDDGRPIVRRTLRRAASFGGRPQPLPRPIEDVPSKQLQVHYLPLPAPEDVVPMSTRVNALVMKSEAGDSPARGVRSITAVTEGLPLPPPSLATKLLRPSLAAFEYHQLVLATDNFAASRCLLKSASGDVFRARVEDCRGATLPAATLDLAVLRLPEYTLQGATEWKSEVQLLAQISHPNVCAVKGYCAHEAGSRFSPRARRRKERLLVFAQTSNGSLYDHLFGGRTPLTWTTRVNIALGAARGLLCIHDRGPLKIAFKEFTASTVLLENDYAPKLAGYGLSVIVPLVHRTSSFATGMTLSQAQAKVSVRSFGLVLLELVTGKNSRDAMYFGDDANFVRWGRECMAGDEWRQEQLIDPRMNGECPSERAMELVRLSLRCVSTRESQRPSLSEVVGTLTMIQAKQQHCSHKPRVQAGRIPEGIRTPPHRNVADVQRSSSSSSSSSDASSSENKDVGMAVKPSPSPSTAPRAFQWV